MKNEGIFFEYHELFLELFQNYSEQIIFLQKREIHFVTNKNTVIFIITKWTTWEFPKFSSFPFCWGDMRPSANKKL